MQHPCHPLVILNYDQIESPKRHPLTRECRGLVLEQGSWDVAARSFTRFFNAGEAPDLESKFDWQNFAAESKEDGSLILLYRYKGEWMVNTRGSFGDGEIAPGVGKSWREVFLSSLNGDALEYLAALPGAATRTAVFELCSPYNKVVRRYEEPTAFLLTTMHNKTGWEGDEFSVDNIAKAIGARRPARHAVYSLKEAVDFLESQDDATFEGFVLRDRTGMRLKVKNSRYVALHHLKGNGNLFATKNLLPLVLKGELDEVLTYYPEAAEKAFGLVEKLSGMLGRTEAVWAAARGKKSQKEFAQFVTKHAPIPSVLFEARKRGVDPKEVWNDSGDVILRRLAA